MAIKILKITGDREEDHEQIRKATMAKFIHPIILGIRDLVFNGESRERGH